MPVDWSDVPGFEVGTGDVWSTVGDLARYAAAVHTGALPSADSRRAFLTRLTSLDEPTKGDGLVIRDGYGYGMFTGTIAGHPAYLHNGDNPGYLSFLAWLPDHEVGLVVLSNDETTDIERILDQMRRRRRWRSRHAGDVADRRARPCRRRTTRRGTPTSSAATPASCWP